MDLKETDILGDGVATHWYYKSKAAATRKLLAFKKCRVILDVGSGSAFFSRDLLRSGQSLEAWCVDISYDKDEDVVENGKVLHFRRSVDEVPADLILLMDVLEHVDDDVALLSSYVAKVPSGATVLISVPAFMFLWSGHDVYLEHKRRYTLTQVEEMVIKSGLKIDRTVYFFGFVLPLAVITRFVGKMRGTHSDQPRSQLQSHNRVVNAILSAMCSLELLVMNMNRIAGLTVFCVATKK